MARFQTAVDSLSLIGGERRARTWNSRIVEPTPASPQAIAKGNLYLQLELGGETGASPRLYRLLLNTIQGVYYDAAGGITGGISEAILAAHAAIQQQNRVYPDQAQLGGISCVVLRGDELYVGIGGPAMVLIGHPGRVEQFPSELGDTVTALGGQEAPTIELFRTSIAGEAMVIQLQSEWVARIPSRKLAAAAMASETSASQEYLETLAPQDAALSALFIHVTPQPVSPSTEETTAPAAVQPMEAAETKAAEPVVEVAEDATQMVIAAGEVAEAATSPPDEVAPETRAVQVVPSPVEEEPSPRRRWPWLLVILVPLLVIAAIAAAFWWQQRNLQLEFESMVQGAEAALVSAQAEGTLAETARSQLGDALDRIQEALVLKPGDEQAQALQDDIQSALDQVNSVVPLYKLITLLPLGGPASDPSRVVVEGPRVHVLDQGTDEVVRYGLDQISGLITDDTAALIAQRGQTLPDGQVVGELIDIVWAAAGGERRSSNLLILDSNNNVLEVDDALGLRPLAIANRDQWQSPQLMASYNGNLYVLDSGLGQILRYRPTDDGYNSPPENYFEGDASIDLSRAVDMAIDGNIWILYSDGTVQKFFGGRQEPFQLESPPNGALGQSRAIHAGSEAGAAQNLYIADRGLGRIVEFDKTGGYLRQYRLADLADQDKLRQMTDLHVEEVDRSFYFLTEEGLYQTDIP